MHGSGSGRLSLGRFCCCTILGPDRGAWSPPRASSYERRSVLSLPCESHSPAGPGERRFRKHVVPRRRLTSAALPRACSNSLTFQQADLALWVRNYGNPAVAISIACAITVAEAHRSYRDTGAKRRATADLRSSPRRSGLWRRCPDFMWEARTELIGTTWCD